MSTSAELALALVEELPGGAAARALLARVFQRPDLDRTSNEWVRDFVGVLGARLLFVEAEIRTLGRTLDFEEVLELTQQAVANAQRTASAEKRVLMAMRYLTRYCSTAQRYSAAS